MSHQLEEIRFLKRIGIKAGVLRLLERGGPAGAGAETESKPGVDEVAAAIAPFLDALRGGNDAFRRGEKERRNALRRTAARAGKGQSSSESSDGGRWRWP